VIDAGLPSERAGWPPGVLDALRQFRQGDIIDAPPWFYFADPRAPAFAATSAADLDGPDVVILDDFCPYGVLTTQTCDIGEEDSSRPVRPFAHVAPVYDGTDVFDGSIRKLLAKGKGSMYLLHLPALKGGFWVADLRLEVPIEKGWLASQDRKPGFPDEHGAERFGQRLVRIRERPAFGRKFVDTVHRPLTEAIRELKRHDREQWLRLVDNVDQVRAVADSRLNPSVAELIVLNDERIPGDIAEWFHQWWDEINPGALAAGIQLQRLRTATYSELSAAEYLASGELELTRVSPG